MKYAVFDADGVLSQCLIEGVHSIPREAVVVEERLFSRLIREHDGVWSLGADGLIEKRLLPDSVPDFALMERAWRDVQLQSTEWLTTRHRDELDLQREPTLSDDSYRELLAYRQTLRDWPAAGAFPESTERPAAPPWITSQSI